MSNNATCLPPIPADIVFITGPTMLGICFNWGFMGILVVQLYFYHISFPNDPPYLKSLVYVLFLLDSLQTGMVTADAFHWFVFGFGNLAQLDDTFLNSWDVVLIDAVVASIVHTFYCWRIYLLRKSYILPIFIMLVSLTQCGAGIATAVVAHKLGHLSLISTEVSEQTTWLVCSAVADICITTAMCWTLIRSKSRVPTSSHGMIRNLVVMTVETNAITTLTAVISLILFLGVPQHSALVVPPTSIIGKLYTNCLIAVLNNRRLNSPSSSRGQTYITSNSSSTQNVRGGSQLSGGVSSGGGPRKDVKIRVVRDVEYIGDADYELGEIQKPSVSTLHEEIS